MVRKWSYLESRDSGLEVNSLESATQLYHFKVFRKTTRFKKFNRGITCMVRKNYARRKHRTNWLILSYITKSWVTNYLKMRQFERFYSTLGRFSFDVFSANFDIFSIKLITILNHSGINIASCSKNIIKRHTNQSSGSKYLENPTQNSNSAVVQTTNLQNILLSTDVYPNLVNLENVLYPYSDIVTSLTVDTNTQLLNQLTTKVFDNTLLFNTAIYSVLINLTLLSINQN